MISFNFKKVGKASVPETNEVLAAPCFARIKDDPGFRRAVALAAHAKKYRVRKQYWRMLILLGVAAMMSEDAG